MAYMSFRNKQHGIALVTLSIVIALAITAFYFSKISLVDTEYDNTRDTQIALKRAKEALLHYAASNWQTSGALGELGELPCPDNIDNAVWEGRQDSSLFCGDELGNGVGYFPWAQVGLNALTDSSGTCLWYVVSPAYKSGPVISRNPDSFGQLRLVDAGSNVISGTDAEGRVVAAIIAPGKALSGQARLHDTDFKCGGDYGNTVAYLDNDGTTNNAAVGGINTLDELISEYEGSSSAVNPLNDRVITITHEEIWAELQPVLDNNAVFNAAMEDLTRKLAECFAAHAGIYGNHMPMPADMNLGGGDYRKNDDYVDSDDTTQNYAGRLPYDIRNSNVEVGIASSEDLIIEECQLSKGILTVEEVALWQNWKDHFFYAISEGFNPSKTTTGCGTCIQVDGTQYAGIVFFSGLKQAGQLRTQLPFDADEKFDPANYLEDNRDDLFPDASGNGNYEEVDAGISNDYFVCINTDMTLDVNCSS